MTDATHSTRSTEGSGSGPMVAFPHAGRSRHPPGNLPLELTSFIGREKEIVEVKRLLSETRLLTLIGPGGCGKTRLALRVASDLVAEFEDGVWLVELASLSDPALVPQAVASALKVREAPGRSLTEVLMEHLKPKKTLLVLDNCEHLVEACARLADVLLRSCPSLRVLATSREALGIAGEAAWLVPSLSLPDPERPPGLESLAHYEAAHLFVERATAASTFAPTERNAPAVARLCQRLEGIPLAIELAAARARVLSVEQISERLDDCFRLLKTDERTALSRHKTLRATIDWSHGLLSEEEKVLFRRLSVFAGGFTLAAAEEVCAGEGIEKDDVLDLISRLVDKSLVLVTGSHGEARYRLLETVRQYGWEELQRSGEAPSMRRHHASFFLRLAEEAEPELNGRDRQVWLDRLEVEHDNLRAALAWGREEARGETGLRFAGTLFWFWLHRGYWSEGRRWLEEALARESGRTAARAKVLLGAGVLAWIQGDHVAAGSWLEESVEIWRALGDRFGLAHALYFLSMEVMDRGDHTTARALAEESVGIFRVGEDRFGLGASLASLGIVVQVQGDYALASSLLQESVEIFRAAGDDWGLALPLRNLGFVAFQTGDHVRAEALLKESLALLWESGEKWFVSRSLEPLAAAVAIRGDYVRAARLFGAAEALRETVGASVSSAYHNVYERGVEALYAGLDEATLATALAEGRAMTLEEALDYALSEPSTPTAGPIRLPVTEPAHEAEARPELLSIFALGPARVKRGERELTSDDWTYAKPRELLYYLLSHPPRTREQIGLALWPEASPSQLRRTFHTTLHRLRRALGGSEWIFFEKDRYAFNRSLDYFFDVEAFEKELAEAQRLKIEVPEQAISRLKEAIGLYKGDFLEDFADSEWALVRREELRRRYGEALLSLGELLFEEGRYTEAVEVYRKAIARDSYLEAAHRGLMRCLAHQGERGRALRHYEALVELLKEELGSPPAPETTELFARLHRGEDV